MICKQHDHTDEWSARNCKQMTQRLGRLADRIIERSGELARLPKMYVRVDHRPPRVVNLNGVEVLYFSEGVDERLF
jgi:hypothetical protein